MWKTARACIVMHHYQPDGTIVTTAEPKPGSTPRNADFWQGTWLCDDGSVFAILEDRTMHHAATPGALVAKVKTHREGMRCHRAA